MSNEQTPTEEVPTERLAELRERLAKLNKTAEKLGCTPISLEVGEPFQRKGKDDYGNDTFAEFVSVFVTGEAPKLNGWSFVATLEHDENGTIIRRVPTFEAEVDLTRYRTATPDNCDHCGYKRRRNDTYIVTYVGEGRDDMESHVGGYDRPEIGTTAQVGSSCLKDFTGHNSPEQIARFCSYLRDFIEDLRGGSYSEGTVTPRYSLEELMSDAIMVVRQHGYISRRKAEETGEIPTGETVKLNFHDRRKNRTHNGAPLFEIPTSEDHDKAVKVIDYVQALTDEDLENDYLYNLFTVCKSGTLTDRQFGIAASAVLPYERTQRQQIEASADSKWAPRTNEYLGEPKDRIDVEFKVIQVYSYDSDYGVQYKHILRSTTGHTLIWKTGTIELDQGATYKANFSVKGHDEHAKYGAQTLVF